MLIDPKEERENKTMPVWVERYDGIRRLHHVNLHEDLSLKLSPGWGIPRQVARLDGAGHITIERLPGGSHGR